MQSQDTLDLRVRVVDGTGAGEIATTSGAIDTVLSVTNRVTANTDQIEGTDATDQIDARINARIVAYGLDHLLSTSVTGTDIADDSIIAKLVSKSATADWDSYNNTTDSHEAIRDRGDAAWITATGFSTHSAADVWAVGTRTLTALGFTLAAADLGAGIITAAKFAAGAIDAASTSADFVTEIRNAITGGAYALDTDANGRVRLVDGTGAGELATTGGALDQVLSLGTQAKADINEQVLDVLTVDTFTEPSQGAPPSTTTLAVMLRYLYVMSRNKKTQTSSELKVFADDTTTALIKQSLSDDGTTLTVGEFSTGA